jgi:hypothetical protein
LREAGLQTRKNGEANIIYNLKQPSENGRIDVTDMAGNILATYPAQQYYGEINFNEGVLASGVYLCTLKQDGRVISIQKFVKL